MGINQLSKTQAEAGAAKPPQKGGSKMIKVNVCKMPYQTKDERIAEVNFAVGFFEFMLTMTLQEREQTSLAQALNLYFQKKREDDGSQ